MKKYLFIAAIILLSSSGAKADAYCYVPDPLTAFLDRIFGNVCYPPVPVFVQQPMPMPPPVAVPIPGAPMPPPPPAGPPGVIVMRGPIYDCPMVATPYPWAPFAGVQYQPRC